MIIAVIGAAAAGKTTFARTLGELLGRIPIFGPRYDEPNTRDVAWARLMQQITTNDQPLIVESCIAPAAYRKHLAEQGSFVVLVEAPQQERARRMHQRGWDQRTIRKLMNYKPPLSADALVDGTQPTGQVAARIAEHIKPRGRIELRIGRA